MYQGKDGQVTGRSRDGQIAIAWIVWKYSQNKIECNPKKLPRWLEKRAEQIGESVFVLMLFVQEVIVPALFRRHTTWQDDSVLRPQFERIALKLAPFELYGDPNDTLARALRFFRAHSFDLREVHGFLQNHIVGARNARKKRAKPAPASKTADATAA